MNLADTKDMRNEIEVEQIDGTTSTIANTGVGSRRHLLTQHWSKLSRFLAVVAQFGLIVWIVRSWQLESLALVRLLGLAFVSALSSITSCHCDFVFRFSRLYQL
jgi:hypothetical protein